MTLQTVTGISFFTFYICTFICVRIGEKKDEEGDKAMATRWLKLAIASLLLMVVALLTSRL